MNKIVFYEVFEEEKKALEAFLPDTVQAVFHKQTIQEVGEHAPAADIISIRTQSIIPNEWSNSLTAILSRSQGYDHLKNFLRQTESKARCGYLNAYCSTAVAEHALLLAMMLLKKIPQQQNQFKTFHRDGLTGLGFAKRKALVVGVGNIGREIVRLARMMDMDVKGIDLDHSLKDLRYVDLKEGVLWAEIIFCALPLTDQTNGLLNAALLAQSSNKPFVVNVSRGEITPLKDLKELIRAGNLSGVALDVFEDEKKLATELRQLKGESVTSFTKDVLEMAKTPNVIFTPHNAFNSVEALQEKARQTIYEIEKFLSHQKFSNIVSVE